MTHDFLVATSINPLDKPFDALTPCEWEEIKQEDIEKIAEAVVEVCEIDELPDEDFGTLYRLRQGHKFLGTFYKKVTSDEWVARTSDNAHTFYSNTEEEVKFSLAWVWVNDKFFAD